MNKKDSIYSRKDSRNSRIPARLSGRESVRLSFPRNGILDNSRATLSAEPVHAAELTILGLRKVLEPKTYFFMIMMLWSDKSELIIYRSLKQVRDLLKNMLVVAPSDAIQDLLEPKRLIEHNYFFGNQRLSVHVKHIDNLVKLFAVMESHPIFLSTKTCEDFFHKSREMSHPIVNTETTSFLILNHDKLESDRFLQKYSAQRRKFMSRIYGNVEQIGEEKYFAISDYTPNNKDELKMKSGDKVKIITKDECGWWFAQNPQSGKLGWVPADYLRVKEPTAEEYARMSRISVGLRNSAFDKFEATEFITTCKYEAKGEREISFDKNVIVMVMSKEERGWWKVRYNGRVGLAPACFLEQYNDPVKTIGHTMLRSHMPSV